MAASAAERRNNKHLVMSTHDMKWVFLLHVVVSGAYWELIFNRMSCLSCILKHTKAQHHHTAKNAITNKNKVIMMNSEK